MIMEDRFYKSTEVADILGVSLRTLYRYMDSGKIESVQLPSGRHRFTKKQIEDFLYKNNLGQGVVPNEPNTNVNVSAPVQQSAPAYTPPSVAQVPQQDISSQSSLTEDEDEELERELDELLKSLDDDGSFNDDKENLETESEADPFAELTKDLDQGLSQAEEVPNTPIKDTISNQLPDSQVSDAEKEADELLKELDSFTSSGSSSILSDEPAQPVTPPVAESVPEPALDENKVTYYYCPYNDLKTVAKMVKKVGDDNNKEYAFTMNAGLSLFFPLDPFSVIHFYVQDSDLDFYKDSLQLKESSPQDANVGLLLTKGGAFNDSREVSGLKVVSKNRLIQNLKANNFDNLASEAESKLD